MAYYPDNRAGHYFTKLPQDIALTGDYEVGLSEIQFSSTYLNIRVNDCYFTYTAPEIDSEKNKPDYGGPSTTTVTVPEGLYESNEFFIHTLNTLIHKEIGLQENGKSRLKFYYGKASKKCSFTMYEKSSMLRFNPNLKRVLGLTSDTFIDPGYRLAQYLMDLNEGFKSIYVYCDLVSARPVGDIMAPLLRIIPVSPEKYVVHHIFEKPHYIPINRFQFNATEILLTTDTGKTISFTSGSTIVTLHFRRKRPDDY